MFKLCPVSPTLGSMGESAWISWVCPQARACSASYLDRRMGKGYKNGEMGAGSVYEVVSEAVCGDLCPQL